jgi:hypothetical protein
MWGAVLEYIKSTGDASYSTIVVNALTLASYGTVGSFLGTNEILANTIEGKVRTLPLTISGMMIFFGGLLPQQQQWSFLVQMRQCQVESQSRPWH